MARATFLHLAPQIHNYISNVLHLCILQFEYFIDVPEVLVDCKILTGYITIPKVHHSL